MKKIITFPAFIIKRVVFKQNPVLINDFDIEFCLYIWFNLISIIIISKII